MAVTLSRDTSARAEQVQVELLRQLPAWGKAQLFDDAWQTGCALAMAGLRARHPGASEAELTRRLMDLLLGEDMAARAFGPLDERALADAW